MELLTKNIEIFGSEIIATREKERRIILYG